MYPSVQSSTIYNSQDMEATQLSINRWTDKEDVVYNIYTMEYYSAIKGNETESFICSDEDEPRVCNTGWSKSEREKQASYINTYIWNLEKWYEWAYFVGQE